MKVKLFFHYISYLQYPFALLGLAFILKPYFTGFDAYRADPGAIYKDFNSVLIFMGLSISFSTLQDTSKTQNKVSLKVWQSPLKGKILLSILSTVTLFLLVTGLSGYFGTEDSRLKEVSFGLLVLSIGLLGMIKTAIEMFENHRLDKNA